MLADGVEASVRSLSSRDEATIRAMVGQIIQERLSDGQLNECDLTIRDLENIREAFVGQLLGMYHQRIAYPQNKVVELESRRERGRGSRGGELDMGEREVGSDGSIAESAIRWQGEQPTRSTILTTRQRQTTRRIRPRSPRARPLRSTCRPSGSM
jgi:hypothetical protein